MRMRIRQAGDRRPLLVDAVVAAAALGVSLALSRQDPPSQWRHFDGLGLALTCLLNLGLVARRRAPVIVLTLYGAIWAWYVSAGYWPVINSAGAMLAIYTVAATRPLRQAIGGTVLMAAVWIFAGVSGTADSVATVLVQSVVWPGTICYLGTGARRSAERGRQLADLAAELQRDQEELARQAVTEERMRIARELHDVVAHHVSVISVHAGLARYVLDSDLTTAHEALDTVLGTSTEALDEMRRLLAVLRMDSDQEENGAARPYAPAPGLADLGDLVDRVRAAGVPVELEVTGARRPLAPGADLCAYRIIQECLTNVLKHAGPADATVTLEYQAGRFVASVRDNGRHPVLAPPGRTGGHGLIGMAERAKLYGGTLTAGPRPQGGFTVVLTLPMSAPAETRAPGPRAGSDDRGDCG